VAVGFGVEFEVTGTVLTVATNTALDGDGGTNAHGNIPLGATSTSVSLQFNTATATQSSATPSSAFEEVTDLRAATKTSIWYAFDPAEYIVNIDRDAQGRPTAASNFSIDTTIDDNQQGTTFGLSGSLNTNSQAKWTGTTMGLSVKYAFGKIDAIPSTGLTGAILTAGVRGYQIAPLVIDAENKADNTGAVGGAISLPLFSTAQLAAASATVRNVSRPFAPISMTLEGAGANVIVSRNGSDVAAGTIYDWDSSTSTLTIKTISNNAYNNGGTDQIRIRNAGGDRNWAINIVVPAP